jgi:hypothetical protein
MADGGVKHDGMATGLAIARSYQQWGGHPRVPLNLVHTSKLPTKRIGVSDELTHGHGDLMGRARRHDGVPAIRAR